MLAHVVRCLAEGASHIPYRDSKLTMMLNKGLGGGSLLHIILALSNSAEQAGSKPPVARRGGRVGRGQRAVSVGRLRLRQVNEGTACLRFGQSCLSMTVNPNANKLEKEQAQLRRRSPRRCRALRRPDAPDALMPRFRVACCADVQMPRCLLR